jgi:predicted nucleic acid-binding protein
MILVDSDILIAHLRGIEAARDWLLWASSNNELAISSLTVTEVAGGMRSTEKQQVWRLLTSLRCEPVTYPIARRAGEMMRLYRRSHSGISTVDYLIAATATELGLSLATLNTRHYPMFPDLTPAFRLPT